MSWQVDWNSLPELLLSPVISPIMWTLPAHRERIALSDVVCQQFDHIAELTRDIGSVDFTGELFACLWRNTNKQFARIFMLGTLPLWH